MTVVAEEEEIAETWNKSLLTEQGFFAQNLNSQQILLQNVLPHSSI